jgi:hypothetical protein
MKPFKRLRHGLLTLATAESPAKGARLLTQSNRCTAFLIHLHNRDLVRLRLALDHPQAERQVEAHRPDCRLRRCSQFLAATDARAARRFGEALSFGSPARFVVNVSSSEDRDALTRVEDAFAGGWRRCIG